MCAAKLVCIGVCLYSWFSTMFALASRRSSTTSRFVTPADSLRTSRIPSSLRSLTSSAIFWPMTSTEVWYGTSVTTMRVSPRRPSSISATARILMEPRPCVYTSLIPCFPRITAPVGKSGPFTIFMRSAGRASGCSSTWIAASTTSRRLCGGMFVAMPTAIPPPPFTSRFGNRAGSTTGSSRCPS